MGGNQTIGSEENSPPPMVRVRVWFRVSFEVRGQFSSGAIFLEPLPVRKFILFSLAYLTEVHINSLTLVNSH